MVDFKKRQLVVSKSGLLVFTDGTGLFTLQGLQYETFSGVVVCAKTKIAPDLADGTWSNHFCPDAFEKFDESKLW